MSDDASPFELLPAEEVERLLPSYSEISFLAKGGMAAVYRGVQTSLDRPVAIKMLPQEFGADESFRLRFVAEGKAMARLNHPNLVGIFDFGQVDHLLYLVMEFVDGQTLYEHAYGTPQEELKAIKLCQKVADGLAHAHEHGILHRDIKPANVLLDENLNPKLGDFGLAEGEEREEGDDLVFGTPGYTSPEVMANPSAADEKADIYAVGVMLYELLTTTIPTDPYQAPSQVIQSDPRIDSVIANAIQPDPAHRYATARDLADALQSLHDQIQAAPRRKLATSASTTRASRTLRVEPATPRPPQPAALATADEAGPSASHRPSAPQAAASNLPLVRNLIVIAFLCVAIFGVWKALKKKEDTVAAKEAKQEEKLARQQRKKEAERTRAQVEREAALLSSKGGDAITPGAPAQTSSPEPEPDPILQLTPREQLAKLQVALANGERDRYPDGTLQRGASRFFFIDEPMTWYHAIEFAETHGAHLAIAANKSDLRWLTKEIPTEDDIWLGAGATSRSSWAWCDESVPFELKLPRTSTKVAGMATHTGVFKASHPSEELPFFIQWHDDGKQPGRREQDFAKIAETLASDNPVWPIGVRQYDERRYLTIGRELSLAEAAVLASQAGGTLAVPSKEMESSFLSDYAVESGLPALWLGAEKRGDSWTWMTNEPWEFARWNEGQPFADQDASGLQINGTGWLSADPYLDAPGFIIEWSDDAADAPEVTQPSTGGSEELTELRERAKRFLIKEIEKTKGKEKDTFAAHGMAMRQWLRNISKEDVPRLEELYSNYLASAGDAINRLPNPSLTPIARQAPEAEKILARYYRQQNQQDELLLAAAEKLRTSYLRKLLASVERNRTKGLSTKIGELQEEIGAIGEDGSSFLRHLELIPKESALQPILVTKAIFGDQGKNSDVTETVGRIINARQSLLVNLEFLGDDPNPGQNKTLYLEARVGTKDYSLAFSKGALVSVDEIFARIKNKP